MKPKVIILYNKIFHYRIPVWNELTEHCDLTVTYSQGDGKVPDGMECRFKIMYLPAKKYKFIVWQNDNIRKLVKDYDAVIAYGNIAWLKYSTLPWFSKTKVIYHTLGVSANYDKGFDEHKEWDKIRCFFYSKADALAFYTDYPIKKYAAMGIPKEKMFVAINTVAVSPKKEPVKKDSILFIGTLYKAKGIQVLLDAYRDLRGKCSLPHLNIIGTGPDYDSIKTWIESNQLDDIIHLKGAIYDINEKAEYFARALACISPKQAGLSVLESMGYGVPFITIKDAITGGEMLNIHNGVDGIILDTPNELLPTLENISREPQRYVEMGVAAQKYYNDYCTPKHMAHGLWQAITYALKK